jgi:hypothetical protein
MLNADYLTPTTNRGTTQPQVPSEGPRVPRSYTLSFPSEVALIGTSVCKVRNPRKYG